MSFFESGSVCLLRGNLAFSPRARPFPGLTERTRVIGGFGGAAKKAAAILCRRSLINFTRVAE